MSHRAFPCAKKVDNFCYICGNYMFDSRKKNITEEIKQLYYEYFKLRLGDQDKPWAPHVVCSTCDTSLKGRKTSGGLVQLEFSTPTYWMEMTDHSQCYFCQTKTVGYSKKTVKNMKYPNVDSVKRPTLWTENDVLPIPATSKTNTASSSSSKSDHLETSGIDFDISEKPIPYTQAALNDLVRNCGLSKEASELLAQSLSDHKILAPDCNITSFRKRHVSYAEFFTEEDDVTFCSDVK